MTFSTEQQAIRSLEQSGYRVDPDKRLIQLPVGEDESFVTAYASDTINYLCREWGYETVI